MRKPFPGLTLIELLIVIVIIGILLAVAIPKFGGRRDKERLGALRTDVRNVQRAEDAYYDQFKAYGSVSQLVSSGLYHSSLGDSASITTRPTGYDVKVVNTVDPENIHSCSLTFTAGTATGTAFDCD